MTSGPQLADQDNYVLSFTTDTPEQIPFLVMINDDPLKYFLHCVANRQTDKTDECCINTP